MFDYFLVRLRRTNAFTENKSETIVIFSISYALGFNIQIMQLMYSRSSFYC